MPRFPILYASLLVTAIGCSNKAQPKPSPAPDVVQPAPAQPTPDPKATATEDSAEDQAQEALSKLARSALTDIEKAGAALGTEDLTGAEKHMTAALETLFQLEAAEPSIRFVRFISDANSTHALKEDLPIGPDEVVLWSDLTREVDLLANPTPGLQGAVGKGSKVTKEELMLIGASVHYHAMAIPIAATHTRLLAAKELLDLKQPAKSLDMIEQILTDIDVLDSWRDAPVWQARALVSRARSAVADGDYDATSAYLTRASALLEEARDAAETGDAEHELAKALTEELAVLRGSIEAGSKDVQPGLQGLEHRIWSSAQRWSTRHTLAKKRNKELGALLDAKTHLDWARAFQHIDKLPESATRMRERAKADLRRALDAADASGKPMIARVLEDFDSLDHTSVAQDDLAANLAYSDLTADLLTLIFELEPR